MYSTGAVEYKDVDTTSRCCLGVLGKSIRCKLQGVGKIHLRKNHSISDSLLQSLPGYMVLITAREVVGFFCGFI